MNDIMKLDLYELLEISPDALPKEIKSAYRKKALSCHPDKNPDNPKAAELFQQLSKALEILTDNAARDAYDKVLKAKKATELRNRALDSKRRKLKDDLEAREQAAREDKVEDIDAAEKLQKEIDRLRREGSKHLEEERERLRQQLLEEKSLKDSNINCNPPRLKVTWKACKGDLTNGGYTYEVLKKIFSKYGIVSGLVVASKKNGRAVVEFEAEEAARMAYENETGLMDNPITLEWVHLNSKHKAERQGNIPSGATPVTSTTAVTATDYESLILMRLRQAEERKRLIAEIEKEDREGT